MPSRLQGQRILVVEDEYMIADELCADLGEVGAVVVGPAGTLGSALAILGSGTPIDGAILDINLRGEMVYPMVDLLRDRGVPIVLSTGYDVSALPEPYSDLTLYEKPIDPGEIVGAMERLIAA